MMFVTGKTGSNSVPYYLSCQIGCWQTGKPEGTVVIENRDNSVMVRKPNDSQRLLAHYP